MNRTQQQGMGLLGWLYVLGISGILFVAALKVGPNYWEYRMVEHSVDSLLREEQLVGDPMITPQKILKFLGSRFYINDIQSVNLKNDVTIALLGTGRYEISINYEVRKNLWANLDVVTSFELKKELDFSKSAGH